MSGLRSAFVEILPYANGTTVSPTTGQIARRLRLCEKVKPLKVLVVRMNSNDPPLDTDDESKDRGCVG